MFAVDRYNFQSYPYSYALPITVSIHGDFTNSENQDNFSVSPMSLILTLMLDLLMWFIVAGFITVVLGLFVVFSIPFSFIYFCSKMLGFNINNNSKKSN